MNKPFLKWAGGKRWLAPFVAKAQPQDMNRYIEPFLGGGAVFFALQPQRAVLSDLNPELVELYRAMRDFPEQVASLLQVHQSAHGKEHYYEVRSTIPIDPIERAARTLYLNRSCFNGLYRVNRKGEFNVPIGTKTKIVDPNESFRSISSDLTKAEIIHADFEDTIDRAQYGDFLFADPPYTVKHNENGFLKYNETIFSWGDQVRLHKALRRAADRGVSILVTNANHYSVRDLYSDFVYRTLKRASVLAGKSDRRGATTEALFSANFDIDRMGLPLLEDATGDCSAVLALH